MDSFERRKIHNTYGTMLYRVTVTKDLRMVQKQLGHFNIQVTPRFTLTS